VTGTYGENSYLDKGKTVSRKRFHRFPVGVKKAGAGQDAAPVRLDHAPVDHETVTRVVAFDDQVFHGRALTVRWLS
jgi:hypothetical protein